MRTAARAYEWSRAASTRSSGLRVVESGFDQVEWSDEVKSKYADDHSKGWEVFMLRVREYAPKATR